MTVILTSTVVGRLAFFLMLGSMCLLSGCESQKRTTISKQQAVESVELTKIENESEQLVLCQKELEALQPVDAKHYQSHKQEFSRLMSGAAQYAGIRERANNTTQETVDALYRYKVKRLCADISQALLNGLADRGERGQ